MERDRAISEPAKERTEAARERMAMLSLSGVKADEEPFWLAAARGGGTCTWRRDWLSI